MKNKTTIPKLRKKLAWTQERLSEESGLNVRTIQRLEAGGDASLETIRLVAHALHVDVSELFESFADEEKGREILEMIEVQEFQEKKYRASENLYKILSILFTLFILGIFGWIIHVLSFGSMKIILSVFWIALAISSKYILDQINIIWLEPLLISKFPLGIQKKSDVYKSEENINPSK